MGKSGYLIDEHLMSTSNCVTDSSQKVHVGCDAMTVLLVAL